MRTGWSKGEIATAVMVSVLGVFAAMVLSVGGVWLAMRAGIFPAWGILVAVGTGLILRVCLALGVDMPGPRGIVGALAAFWAADAAVATVIFAVPAFYILYDRPSALSLAVLVVAGVLIGVSASLLVDGLGIGREERGEVFPEVRAHVRGAEALFRDWKNALGLAVGGAAACFHVLITDVLGFARGIAGFRPLEGRGPDVGLDPDAAWLGIGYLAGPRIAVTALVTLVVGKYGLATLLYFVLPGSVLGEHASVWFVSRCLGMGAIAGAVPGYVIWAIVSAGERKVRWLPVAICLLVGLVTGVLGLGTVAGISAGGVLFSVLGSLVILVLAMLGSVALTRGAASMGIVPVSGLLLLSVFSASFLPHLLSGRGPTELVWIAVPAALAAAVAVVHASTMRAAEMLGYPRTAVSVQVPVFTILLLLVAVPVLYLLGRGGYGLSDMPAPQGHLIASMAERVVAGLEPAWPLYLAGFVIGLVLSLSKLPALAAALALYLPASMVVTAVIGGLIRLVRSKKDDGSAGALCAGLIAGAVLMGVFEVLSYTMELDLDLLGVRALGDISHTGWFGLPTFLLIVVLLVVAAVMARKSGSGEK